ncbi:hypothetical protein CASFOL_022777 [Castilleja foliolosa]|uniref:Uncharacterized protein n=1 Tax=Castilleja foliolosa TaxID=1961234 RepID=A0ABD3CX65_9LAMI
MFARVALDPCNTHPSCQQVIQGLETIFAGLRERVSF